MASPFIDTVITMRILFMLVTPFQDTEAFKYGIIDKDGKALKKTRDLKSDAERAAYTPLNKLVFSLKRLIGKVPGGKSKIASIAAAYYLVKESYETKLRPSEARVRQIMESEVTLVEEEILVERFLNEEMSAGINTGVDAGEIPNVTGAAVSTDQPAIYDTNKPQLFRRLKRKKKN